VHLLERKLHTDQIHLPTQFRNATETHLFGLIVTASGSAENPDNWMFSLKAYNGIIKSSCYSLEYVPTSKPFDHTRFEVTEAKTLYCT
jgi:hypothetical protein